MATIKTTIGAGVSHSVNVDIQSVSGSGPYIVTVDTTSGCTAGDALWDESAPPVKCLIESVDSGTQFTTKHQPTAEGDVTGVQAVCKRYYNGSSPLSDWDDGLDSSLYGIYDHAIGEVWKDDDIDDKLSLDGWDGWSQLTSVTLTVAASERHDGTPDSGARIVSTVSGPVIDIATTGVAYTVEWLEITQDASVDPSSTQNYGIKFGQDDDPIVGNVMVYGIVGATHTGRPAIGIGKGGSRALPQVRNCMVFSNGGGTSDAAGGVGISFNANNAAKGVLNCTVHDNHAVGAYGGLGIQATNLDVRNCISTDNDNGDFSGTYDTKDYDLSSDTTADGANSLVSKASGDQYVSNSGSYDLLLKAGADAEGAGVDLQDDPSGIGIDITGFDRHGDDSHDPWDIGCHELQAAAGGTKGTLALTGVGI